MQEEIDLFEFPCEFPIKVIGKSSQEFDSLVVNIIRRHCQDLKEGVVSCRPSRQGKYTAVTVTIIAHSRQQLDALYQDLSQDQAILMVL